MNKIVQKILLLLLISIAFIKLNIGVLYAQVLINPLSQNICIGSNTIIRINNIQPPNSTYRWQDSTSLGWVNLVNNLNVFGVTNDTLSFNNINFSFNNKKYRCIVDSAGLLLRKDTSNVSLLLVYNQFNKPVIGTNQLICYNSVPQTINITQQSTGANGVYTYQWQKSLNGLLWSDIPSATNFTYLSNALNKKTFFRLKSTSNCGVVFSDSIVISLYDSLIKPTISPAQTVCYGFKSDTIRIVNTATSGNNVFNYQWQESTNGTLWSDILNATQTKLVLSNNTILKYIRIKAVSTASCGTLYSDSIRITVLPILTKPTISTAQTICYGFKTDTIKMVNSATGGNNIFNYQWQESINGTLWSDILNATQSKLVLSNNAISKYIRMKAISTASCGTLYSDTIRITVRPILIKPTLSTAQTICYGFNADTIKMVNSASGGNNLFNYQWQESLNGTLWADILNATQTKLVLSNNTMSKYIRMKAISIASCGTLYSDSIRITVRPILTRPTVSLAQTVCYGYKSDTIKIVNSATGGNNIFNYQWQESLNGTLWADILNATQTKLVLSNNTISKYIRLKAISTASCGTLYSDSIRITVRPILTKPTISAAQIICYDKITDTIKITQIATGADENFVYQWQSSSNGINWTDLVGKTGFKYVSNNLKNDIYYRVNAISVINCGNIYSDAIFIDVLNKLTPGIIGDNQNICYNTIPSQIVFKTLTTGVDGIYTYQWQVSNDSIQFIDINGETSNILNINNLIESKYYRVKINSTFGCGFDFSNVIKIKVYIPYIGTKNLTLQPILCYNSNSDSIGIVDFPVGGSLSYNFLWQTSTDSINWNNIINNNKSKLKLNNVIQNTYVRLISLCIKGCGIDTSQSIRLLVYPNMISPTIGNNQSICFNAKPDTLKVKNLAQGADGNFSYQWQTSLDNANWSDIIGQTSTSLGFNNQTTTKYYRLKAISLIGCGNVYSTSIMIEVYGQLTSGILSSSQNICFNSTPNLITFTTLPSGVKNLYNYQWQISDDSLVFNDIPGAISTNFQETLLLNSKYYRVKVVSILGCGTEYTNIIKINVYPPLVSAEIQGQQSVCYDLDASTLSIFKSPTGADNKFSYQWQYSIDNIIWSDLINANNLNYLPLRVKKDTYYRLKVTSLFGCGNVFSNSILLNVLPLPDTTDILGITSVCKNQQDVHYTLSNINSQYSYNWSITGAQTLTSINNNNMFLKFGNLSFIDTLKLSQVNKSTGCINVMKLPIVINNSVAPSKSEIRRKPNTNLLFCSDSTNNIRYQWGYIAKATNQITYIEGANKQYVLLPHSYDTSQFIYFVDTKLDECETRSYINFSLYTGLDHLINNGISVYPNPVINDIKINSKYYQITRVRIYNLLSNLIFEENIDSLSYLSIKPSLNPGVYMLELLTSDNIIFRNKIVVQ
jgi:hypothetical protein